MAVVKDSQMVKLFEEESHLVMQSVSIDTEDAIENGGFISVTHYGEEMNMTVQNWNRLVNMVEEAKKKAGLPAAFTEGVILL